MNNDIKAALLELFNDAEIPHGQRFDDSRRWCGICNLPRAQLSAVAEFPWKNKMCHECSAVWPEYINDFIASVNDDDETLDAFDRSVIN